MVVYICTVSSNGIIPVVYQIKLKIKLGCQQEEVNVGRGLQLGQRFVYLCEALDLISNKTKQKDKTESKTKHRRMNAYAFISQEMDTNLENTSGTVMLQCLYQGIQLIVIVGQLEQSSRGVLFILIYVSVLLEELIITILRTLNSSLGIYLQL